MQYVLQLLSSSEDNLAAAWRTYTRRLLIMKGGPFMIPGEARDVNVCVCCV
jgi:hypothetical protein